MYTNNIYILVYVSISSDRIDFDISRHQSIHCVKKMIILTKAPLVAMLLNILKYGVLD